MGSAEFARTSCFHVYTDWQPNISAVFKLWQYKWLNPAKTLTNGLSLTHFLCLCLCARAAVLPDSPNFPYRRYDRLPPISQFSIESDSDLSETAELIEEYEVFDPSRPRPKVILVIGKGQRTTHTHTEGTDVLGVSAWERRTQCSPVALVAFEVLISRDFLVVLGTWRRRSEAILLCKYTAKQSSRTNEVERFKFASPPI